MRLIFSKGIFVTILFYLISGFLNGQEVLWTYHLSDETENLPTRFWVDEDGVSHLNIIKGMSQEGKRVRMYNESYMVKISIDGAFAGSISINRCKNRDSFLPFRKNRYLIYGNNCLENGKGYDYNTRLIDEKGKLIKTGETLPDYRDLLHLGEERITIFSSKLDFFNYPNVNIGHLNRRLKAKYRSVSIKELELEGHGITLSGGDPLKIGKDDWVIPFRYGVHHGKNNSTMRMIHGGFFVVNKDKISWKYIPEGKFYYPFRLDLYNDQIFALLIKNNRPTKYMKIFNLNGSIISEFKLPKGLNKIRDMKVQDEKIVFLTLNYLIYCSFSGEVLKKIRLPEMEMVQSMKIYGDRSVLIAGTQEKKTLLTKIGFQNDILEKAEESKEELIKFTSIEHLSEEETTVSVFPNPTTRTLNFNFQFTKSREIFKSCLIVVLDSSGSEMMKKQMDIGNAQIDVSNLASGIYFYRILTEKSAFISGQFIKI